MIWRLGLLAVLGALLAGCAPTPAPLPPGPTDAEAKALAVKLDARIWADNVQYFPDRFDMEKPQVEVIDYIHRAEWAREITHCLVRAGVNATIQQGGIAVEPGPGQSDGDMAYADYICELQYPVDPAERGYLSAAQVEYMYDFFSDRLVPCLRLMGYSVTDAPLRSAFVEGYETNLFFGWVPYYDVQPQVQGEEKWREIDWRCGSLPDPFPTFH